MPRRNVERTSVFEANDHVGPSKLNLAFEGVNDPSCFLEKHDLNVVQVLDLSQNTIIDLDFLARLPALHTLILDRNRITSHSIFPPLLKLTLLSINENGIENLSLFVKKLSESCPNLKFISMMKNEAAPSFFNGGTLQQYQDYRLFVTSHFAHLEMLDGENINDNDRQNAYKIYGRRWKIWNNN